MSNVIFPNVQPVTVQNPFSLLWKLSRAMKKAGWIYKSSGNGSSKDTSGTAANDLWGGNTDPALDPYAAIGTVSTGAQTLPTVTLTATNPQTAGFPTSGTLQVATSTNGWQTVTYTGTTAASFTGCSGGAGTVPTGSAIGNVTINMDTVAGWWNAQGPSTLKIPINTAATQGADGYFWRGENISQATTGAQGEIIGYIFDGYAGQGFLVVMPRVDGSGADPHGWNHTSLITGAFSGCTVTPSATVIEFVREVVFWKGTTTDLATTYMQCIDNSAENAQRFSVLAGSTGCTASVAPGGGGTANAFPTAGTYAAGGTGGSQNGNAVFVNDVLGTGTLNIGRAQIIAVNSTFSTGVSADGSFLIVVSNNSAVVNSQSNYTLWGYQRTDFQEDGDVDPYVFWTPSNDSNGLTGPGEATVAVASNGASLPQATINISGSGGFNGSGGSAYIQSSNGIQYITYTGTGAGTLTGCAGGSGTLSTGNFVVIGPTPGAKMAVSNLNTITQTFTSNWNAYGSGTNFLRMNRRRGFATADSPQNGTLSSIGAAVASTFVTDFFNIATYWDREKVAHSFRDNFVGENIWAIGGYAGFKIRKGILRWMKMNIGSEDNIYGFGTKSWISISTTSSPTSLPNGSLIIGPWDGVTTPTAT